MMNEIGRKTHFWYRIYCALYAILGLLTICFGLLFFSGLMPTPADFDVQQIKLTSAFYVIAGLIVFGIYAVALFLPPKPYSWVLGIVLIIFQMTNCLLLPFLVPLLIYWLKPETKAFFGRN